MPVSSSTIVDFIQIFLPSLRSTCPCHAQICPFFTGFRYLTASSEVATISQLWIMASSPLFWSAMVAVAPPCWMLGCPQSCSLGLKMQYACEMLSCATSSARKQVPQKLKPSSRSLSPQSRKDLLSCMQPFMMLCFSSFCSLWWWMQDLTIEWSSCGSPLAGTAFLQPSSPAQTATPPKRHPYRNLFIAIPLK